MKESLKQAEKKIVYWRETAKRYERRYSALKGVVTRMKNKEKEGEL